MKNTLGYAVALAIVLIGLEVGVRFFHTKENSHYLEISRDFKDLQRLIEDRHKAKRPPKYYDYHLYAPHPFETPTIAFTEYWSSRRTPASLPRSQASTIVWTFGGSTMMNAETSDELSIANTIAKSFVKYGLKTRVENFGVGSFQSSLELIRFSHLLAQVPESERPTIAIFYDGYNDARHGYMFGAGRIQYDLGSKIATLVERRYGQLALYGASAWLAQHSHAWGRIHNGLQRRMFTRPEPDTSDANLDRTVKVYLRNVAMTDAICGVFQIRCFFFLQPLVVTKEPLGPIERKALARQSEAQIRFVRKFYASVSRDFANKENFVNLSDILDGRQTEDFFDLGHTSALTSPIIGEAIAEQVRTRLRK